MSLLAAKQRNAANQRKYREKFAVTINELKTIVSPDSDIPAYQILGQTVALLTGTIYKIEKLAHVKVRNWYRIKENEEWKKLKASLIDKGLAKSSDKLTKQGVLERVIQHFKAASPSPSPAPVPAPIRPANRSFFIENLLKKDTAPIPPPTHFPAMDFDDENDENMEIDVVG